VINITIIIISVLFSVFFIVKLTSFFIFITIRSNSTRVGFFIFHIFVVIKTVTNIVVIQDIDSMVELGSKMENRFVIILLVFLWVMILVFLLSVFVWGFMFNVFIVNIIN